MSWKSVPLMGPQAEQKKKNQQYKTLSLKIHNVLLPFQRFFSDVLDICNILKGFDFVL